MATKPTINSIEDVIHWMETQRDFPYWVLRNGHGTGKTNQYIGKNEEFDDLNEAKEYLQNTLHMYRNSGGYFTLQLSDKSNNSHPNRTAYIKLASSNAAGAAPGIAGVSPHVAIAGGVDAYLAQQKRMWEQERDIEDLKAAIDAPINKMESITRGIGNMGIDLNGILQSVLPVLAAKMMGTPGAINGTESQVGISKEQQIAQLDNTIAQASALKDQILNAPDDDVEYDVPKTAIDIELDRIGQHFPDIDQFLRTVADFIDANPAQAKILFDAQS